MTMIDKPPGTCVSCVYFKMTFDGTGEGDCRRYAPRVIADVNTAVRQFPTTFADLWCGDYASTNSLAAERMGRLEKK